MRFRASVIVAVLILTAIAPLASAGMGYDSGLAVFITYPDGEYDIGDDLIVTVHVFYAGEYHTPNKVSIDVGETSRDVGLTEESTGRYKGVVTIADDDLDEDGDLSIDATARDTGILWDNLAYDWAYITTMAGTGLDVEVRILDPMDMYPGPGDDVEFQVLITYRDSPTDPDSDSLEVVYTDPAENEHDLDVTRVGTGIFEGTFAVPSGLRESSVYTIWAEAEYTPGTRTLSEDMGMDVDVQFFDIWAHIVSVTPSTTEMEIYVLGLDGTAVEGAQVDLDWIYEDDAEDERTGSSSGTTDADGNASFSVTYTDLGKDAHSVGMSGSAVSGGYTQLFEGEIYVREFPGWSNGGSDNGFSVEIVNPGPYEGGESITLEHVATWDGEPLASTEVSFYLVDPHKIHRFGTETTDPDGEFDFPLNLPQAKEDEFFGGIECNYQYGVGIGWSTDYDYLFIGDLGTQTLLDDMLDPKVSMSVGTFSPGEMVKVTVDHPDADGTDEFAMLVWGIGEMPDWEEIQNLEWESWSPGGINLLRITPGEWVDDHYEATFGCPAFLTTEDEIYIYSIIVFEDEGDIFDAAHAAKKEGVSPLPPNPAPTAGIDNPLAAEKVGGKTKIKGTASDDTSVEKVEVRIDGGAWMEADGTTSWTYELDTKKMVEGNHTVEVRSWDGEKYSDVQEVTFEVDQSVAKEEDDTPGFGTALATLAMLGAVLLSRRRIR